MLQRSIRSSSYRSHERNRVVDFLSITRRNSLSCTRMYIRRIYRIYLVEERKKGGEELRGDGLHL